jgi:hypothetical protein
VDRTTCCGIGSLSSKTSNQFEGEHTGSRIVIVIALVLVIVIALVLVLVLGVGVGVLVGVRVQVPLVLVFTFRSRLVFVPSEGKMDMTKFLRLMLTNENLRDEFAGHYEGIVADVTEESVFNRWKLRPEFVPRIQFEDGWAWIPNIGARRVLSKAWGNDSDLWIGRRLAITLTTVTRTERASGRLIEKLEKTVKPLPDVAEVRCISEGRTR